MRSAASALGRHELEVVAGLRGGQRAAGEKGGPQFHPAIATRRAATADRAGCSESISKIVLRYSRGSMVRAHVAFAFAAERSHQARDRGAARAHHAPPAGVGSGEIGEAVAQRLPAMHAGRDVARERVLRIGRETRTRQSQSRASSLRSSTISYISAGLSEGSTRSGTIITRTVRNFVR